MKKIFKALALALAGAMFMVACDDTPAPYNPNPGGGEGGKDTTVVTEKKITCAEAAELCGKLTDGAQSVETYVITGYITDVFANINNNQQSFWMADTKDGGKVVQAFWANFPEGVEKFTVGSKVTITGKLLKYVKPDGTVITEVKNPTVVIKEQGGDETPDQPIEGTPAGTGVETDPYNVAGALTYIQNLPADEKPEASVYTKGVISEVVRMGESGSIQFKMQDKNVNNSLLVYFCNNLGDVPFKALTDLKVGDEVVVCGKVVNFKGNTPEYAPGACLVSLNGKTEGEGGGNTPGGEEKPGVGNTIVMSEAYSSCTDGSVEAGTITFGDATITFEKNDGNNAPMYYFNKKESLRSVRMYAKNSMEMTATKNIAKVVINCAAPYQGTNYNGNDQMTTTAGTISKSADKLSVTIDGINSKSFTLANEFTATTKGTQLRIVSMTITYAE